jgi:hypothetical protein
MTDIKNPFVGGLAALGAAALRQSHKLGARHDPLDVPLQELCSRIGVRSDLGLLKAAIALGLYPQTNDQTLPRRRRGAPRGIRPSEEDKKAMAMIDDIQREYGLSRRVVQPVVIGWMVETGKFKVQERSTHRKRLNRYYHERLGRALLGI